MQAKMFNVEICRDKVVFWVHFMVAITLLSCDPQELQKTTGEQGSKRAPRLPT